MKNKIHKILGIGLTLVLALALVGGFALPAGAAVEKLNEWYKFEYPVQGELGGWFMDSTIEGIGPMARAINDDVYAYAELSTPTTHRLYKSTDGARSWAATAYELIDWDGDLDPDSGAIVDMVCSSIDEDVIYATDGNYVYKSSDGGDTWIILGKDSLEKMMLGCACGIPVSGTPITCLDVGYGPDDAPYVFIGVTSTCSNIAICPSAGEPSVLYINEEGFPAQWTDLDLHCYSCGGYTPYSVGVATDFADSKKAFAVVSNPWTILFYANTAATVTVTAGGVGATLTWTTLPTGVTCSGDCDGTLGSGGTCTFTASGTNAGGSVCINVTAGSITESVALAGSVRFGSTHVISTVGVSCSWSEVSQLLKDCDPDCPFSIQEASRIAFPDDYEDTETVFVGVTGELLEFGGDVYMATVTSPITPAAQDMNVAGIWSGCVGKVPATNIISLDIYGDTDSASLIAGVYGYVDDEDPHLFNEGTDVYCSSDGGWSWDVSTKDPTGGDPYMGPGPLGPFENGMVEALWYDGMGLAATEGCECAVSLCCGEDYPCEFFSQVSLIATDITCVIGGDHSPEYLSAGSETMYMLTECDECCDSGTESLFRHDGTYWERVFCSTISGAEEDTAFEMVEVSPDFDETSVAYLFNSRLEGWRTTDAGCSWDKMTFPCATRPDVSAGVVVDEDTVIAGGSSGDAGWIFKTTRHGARPWKAYEMSTTIGKGNAVSFDLEPGYEDPGYVLYGDDNGRVWLSEDGGETWELVGSGALAGCVKVLGDNDVWVVFDPGFNTAGDDGENTIYAAAGDVIARCTIDWDEDIVDQEWVKIYSNPGDDYLGIEAEGDTALYVTNAGCDTYGVPREVTTSGTIAVICPETGDTADLIIYEDVDEISGHFIYDVVTLIGELVSIIEYNLVYSCEEDTPLNFVGVTTPIVDPENFARDGEVNIYGSIDGNPFDPSGQSTTPLSDAEYNDIEADDGNRHVTAAPGYGKNAWIKFRFYVGDPTDICRFDATWVGRGYCNGYSPEPVELAVYNDATEEWEFLDQGCGPSVDFTLEGSFGCGAVDDYVDGDGYVWLSVFSDEENEPLTTNYVELVPYVGVVEGQIGLEGVDSGATGMIDIVEYADLGCEDQVVKVISSYLTITEATGVTPAAVESCVVRSLNPLDDVKPTMKVVFERLTDGLAGECLYGLAITHDVSDEGCDENVLWTLESPCEPENVWVYEDTTAQPVIAVAPLDERKLGVTDEVTLEWAELCGVECYEVSLFKYCAACPEEKVAVAIADACPLLTPECTTAETCIVIDDLEAGTTYYWQVRACMDHPTLSKWSEERTFITALGVTELVSPACGADSVIISTSFNWTAVTGATSYDIELATTETFTTGVIRGSSTVNAWAIAEPLDYATTYYWRVRAHADGVYSDWVVGIFTTAAKAIPAPPPVVVEPTPPAPVVPTPIIEMPPTPSWVWAIIGIGAALAVVVIVLIVRTRRPPA